MIYTIDNSVQVLVLVVCTFIAVRRAFEQKSRAWTLLAFFFADFALDDLYMVVSDLTVGWYSTLSVVSELSWYASYLFLYLLIRQTAPLEERAEKHLLPWLGPVFSLAMAVFYMQWGDIASNLIYAAVMGLVMFAALRRLIRQEAFGHVKLLCTLALLFCFLEYAMWTVSGYFREGILSYLYYLFDFLITLTFPFFIAGTAKAVKK